jgi:hypothetical protein
MFFESNQTTQNYYSVLNLSISQSLNLSSHEVDPALYGGALGISAAIGSLTR